MTLQERVDKGQAGEYVGLDNGLGEMNNSIYNTQRGLFTLIGGPSGSAKTTLLDFILQNNLEDAESKKIQLDVFYYSYEIKEMTKKANWLSVRVYRKYGVTIEPPKIQGLGGLKMTTEEKKLVDAEIPYIDALFNKINFRFDPTNPTGIYHELLKHAEANGTFLKEPYINELGEKKMRITGYKPNNPNAYVLVAIDHIAHRALSIVI